MSEPPFEPHTCAPPMRDRVYTIPRTWLSNKPVEIREPHPHGQIGTVWRCHTCRKLWRVGHACTVCDAMGGLRPHPGTHVQGYVWRAATVGQRLRYALTGGPRS